MQIRLACGAVEIVRYDPENSVHLQLLSLSSEFFVDCNNTTIDSLVNGNIKSWVSSAGEYYNSIVEIGVLDRCVHPAIYLRLMVTN